MANACARSAVLSPRRILEFGLAVGYSGVTLGLRKGFSMAKLAANRHNFLLAAMPAADHKRLAAGLKLVRLRLGTTLYKSEGPLDHAYFPTTSIVSMISSMRKEEAAEIAITAMRAWSAPP